jgi:hypothetical protein
MQRTNYFRQTFADRLSLAAVLIQRYRCQMEVSTSAEQGRHRSIRTHLSTHKSRLLCGLTLFCYGINIKTKATLAPFWLAPVSSGGLVNNHKLADEWA